MTDPRDVTEMFDDISPRYDFLNHLLSMNLDKGWRAKASKLVTRHLRDHTEARILDVATGTADLALRMADDLPSAHLTGIDLSQKMLDLAARKVKARNLEQRIDLLQEDALALPFHEGSFDAVTVAFGVRNFGNLSRGVMEMARVLKQGGVMVILEFSTPTNRLVKAGYTLYVKRLLPWIGRVVSGHKTAYRYLPESIERFPDPEANMRMLKEAGLKEVAKERLFGGVATLYHGLK